MSHTPGPWDWKDGFQCAVGPESDPEGNAVAVIVGHPVEAFDNARLIAAAPDLLEALCHHSEMSFIVIDWLKRIDGTEKLRAALYEMREVTNAAISKATGSEAQHG